MSDQPNIPQPDDDAEGHGFRGNFDAEAATEDDVEGHRIKFKMDSEAATEDDVEGHVNFMEPEGPQDPA